MATMWRVSMGWLAVALGAAGAVACGRVTSALGSDELVVQACLAQLVVHFEEVPPADAEGGEAGRMTLTCANPYGFAACTTAWQAARKTSAESDIQAAIAVCAPALCAGLEAPRPEICDRPADTRPPSFAGLIMWMELHRVVLERDLGHPQAMGILGFLAGALKPSP